MDESKATYQDTMFAGKMIVGKFHVRPHWEGTADADEIRAIMRRATVAFNAHEALVEAAKWDLRNFKAMLDMDTEQLVAMRGALGSSIRRLEVALTLAEGKETV